ncbi:hypothetical protein GUJ93_ZPchr0458g22271 [Zizania palustris]|uniref:Uncharacterized protein n=1 Tax=Zizania palustris TaxID=103762 RepID=A0A8J5V2T0_ZIZPA|nr:hypothetical protein GUJ93_ZPchr0458g22271 [Zizania palustris]
MGSWLVRLSRAKFSSGQSLWANKELGGSDAHLSHEQQVLEIKKEQGTRFLQLPLARDFAHIGAILLGPWEVVRPVDVAGGQVEAVGGDSKMNTLIWYGWLGGVIIGTMIGANTVLEAHCKVRPHNIVITGSTRGLGKALAHSPESFLEAINELEENM